MSYSLWPHGLQHARLPCPSLSPRVCSNSCPLSQWCHPTITSSVAWLASLCLELCKNEVWGFSDNRETEDCVNRVPSHCLFSTFFWGLRAFSELTRWSSRIGSIYIFFISKPSLWRFFFFFCISNPEADSWETIFKVLVKLVWWLRQL